MKCIFYFVVLHVYNIMEQNLFTNQPAAANFWLPIRELRDLYDWRVISAATQRWVDCEIAGDIRVRTSKEGRFDGGGGGVKLVVL